VRTHEASVDVLIPGSLSVGVRSAAQSIMASMRSVWSGRTWLEAPATHSQTVSKVINHSLSYP